MGPDDVLEVLDLLAGTGCWLDGGWGVDALLGEQTRPHGDLDLVVPRPVLDQMVKQLEAVGFVVIRDWLPTTLAFRDGLGREVDLHPVDPTPDGGGDQVLEDGSHWHYGPPVTGAVGGRPVRCAAADEQVAMHVGYPPRPVDVADVRRLVDRFGIPLPTEYALDEGDTPAS